MIAAELRHTRQPVASKHTACMWCGRLLHRDHRLPAHGKLGTGRGFDVAGLARLNYSHGVCRADLALMLARAIGKN